MVLARILCHPPLRPPRCGECVVVQLLTSKLVKPHKRPYLERSSLSGLGIFFNLGLLIMNAFGIGSAYLMALASVTFTVVTTLNDFVIIGVGQIEEKLVAPDNRVSAWVYPIMTVILVSLAWRAWRASSTSSYRLRVEWVKFPPPII